jgi:hypothetical protein
MGIKVKLLILLCPIHPSSDSTVSVTVKRGSEVCVNMRNKRIIKLSLNASDSDLLKKEDNYFGKCSSSSVNSDISWKMDVRMLCFN